MKYVSLDIETTGLDYSTCQILEVGVIVDDLDWPDVIGVGPYGGRPHIRILIDNGPLITGERFALDMNQTLLKEIAATSEKWPADVLSPMDADSRLAWFLGQHFDGVYEGRGKVVAAGKNVAGFDIPFLKAAGFRQTCATLHHRSVDPAMLYWEPGDQNSPSQSQCLQRAGIAGEVAHTACADAWQVIQLIRHKLVKQTTAGKGPFTTSSLIKAREMAASLPPSQQNLLIQMSQSTNEVAREVVVPKGFSDY